MSFQAILKKILYFNATKAQTAPKKSACLISPASIHHLCFCEKKLAAVFEGGTQKNLTLEVEIIVTLNYQFVNMQSITLLN